MTERFDWTRKNDDVFAAHQRALAIYTNEDDQIVLRQERSPYEREDSYVVIDQAHVPDLIAKLRDLTRKPVSEDGSR